MTRSDYIKLAEALRMVKPSTEGWDAYIQWTDDCNAICDAIAADNGAFDKALFLSNCWVTV